MDGLKSGPRVLLTGAAGFIGSHVVEDLLRDGYRVTGVDNFDPFYGREVKVENLKTAARSPQFRFHEVDIRNPESLFALEGDFLAIIHLAAKAGVRPSIQNPLGYYETNVRATHNLLELARHRGISRFVFASSSSVYGINPDFPWREDQSVLLPISPYASSKISGELLGHVYSHLYGIRFMALRFFTVYGPRQRPDLAIHKFARMMLRGETIPIFGDGSARRDYTYIADIVKGIRGALEYQATIYEVVNLGNDRPIALIDLVHAIEEALGVRARLEHRPMQAGDVPHTWADISKARKLFHYAPETGLNSGLASFSEWLLDQPALASQATSSTG